MDSLLYYGIYTCMMCTKTHVHCTIEYMYIVHAHCKSQNLLINTCSSHSIYPLCMLL